MWGIYIMANKEDRIEKKIKEDLYKKAEEIREEISRTEGSEISEELKEDIRIKLQEQIDAYEEEKAYAGLSEEDREALRLGREIRDGRKAGKGPLRMVRGKRRWRMYAAVAAAMVLVLAIGMTSMGGAERIASVIEQFVGEREVVKVNSDEGNMVSESEDEQKAYEEMKNVFGVEPVKMIKQQKNLEFVQMNLDENLQVAELIYRYNDKNLWYIISAGYYGSSFGFDVEDEIIEKQEIKMGDNIIELTTYRVEKTKEEKCSAHFTYNTLEYFLTGMMGEEEFKLILENLYFL